MKIKKVSQGSSNAHSDWAKTGFNFMKQLLVRFQIIVPPFNDPPLPNVAQNGTPTTPVVSILKMTPSILIYHC